MTPKLIAILRTKWLWPLLVVAVLFVVYRSLKMEELSRYTNNVVYLTRYASITVPGGGVYGFAPGTKFTVDPTRQPVPDMVFVTDGVHQLAIEPDALTHNSERARILATSDQQGQTLSAAAIAAEKLHVSKAERDAQLSRARDIEAMNARQHSALLPVSPAPTATPFVRKPPPLR